MGKEKAKCEDCFRPIHNPETLNKNKKKSYHLFAQYDDIFAQILSDIIIEIQQYFPA